MIELIGAADIYITPYKHKEQVVSGTLAYAFSAGKAIISTPYLHAIELLDDERGALVPFDDPGAIAAKTVELLDNSTARHAMRKRAYLYARDMVWNRVAQKYMKSFERIYNERLRNPRATFSAQNTEKILDRLPAVKLDHLHRMTDSTGIVEHALFVVPNYPEGYSTDDNARALIVASCWRSWRSSAPPARPTWLPGIWLSLWLAFDPNTKRFRNLSELRTPMARAGRLGRQPWAGAVGIRNRSRADPRTQDCGERLGACLNLRCPSPSNLRVPRACAFTLLGLQEYLEAFPGDRAASVLPTHWRIDY